MLTKYFWPFLALSAVFGYITFSNLTTSFSAPLNTPGALLAAVIFLIGLIFVNYLPRYKFLAASVLLAIITPVALSGFYFSPGDLGISDWDYYLAYHSSIRRMVVEQGEFPFWNPYTCGGTAGLADPEFSLFTPSFLFELIFGVEAGFPLAIFFVTAAGAIGMLWLGRELKLSLNSSILAAIIFAFGSVNILEIVEGHPNIFSAMWIPWIFLFWLKAYRSNKALPVIITAILLAFTFFQGGIYLLMYTAFTFLVLILALPNKKHALKVTVISGLLALGLASVKLVPTLFWLSQFQDAQYASSASTLSSLHHIFLGRYLHNYIENIIPNQGSAWHEYGAYIGPIALALAIAALVKLKNKTIQLLLGLSILAILISATGPTLKPLFDQASWLPRSNISRFIMFAIIPMSLLAGKGLRLVAKNNFVKIFIVGLVAFDLFSLSLALSRQAFILPNMHPSPPPAPAPIAYTIDEFKHRVGEVDHTRAYANTKAGYGTLHYCSVLGPKPSVRPVQDPEGFDYIEIDKKESGSGKFINWSPNKVTIKVTVTEPADVILNANYASGWLVNNEAAREIRGRLATNVPAGEHTLTFNYQAPGFKPGLVISLASLALVVTLLFRHYKVK